MWLIIIISLLKLILGNQPVQSHPILLGLLLQLGGFLKLLPTQELFAVGGKLHQSLPQQLLSDTLIIYQNIPEKRNLSLIDILLREGEMRHPIT